MEPQTNLRLLRFRNHISLTELAVRSGVTKQYLCRAELGEIAATARLETQMAAALEAAIAHRKAELQALETDYETYKGRLFKKEEGDLNEQ